ncbi:MAG TPA: hypothetical protein VF800_00325 [Telluria sp.]|jgi:hypothetical protein
MNNRIVPPVINVFVIVQPTLFGNAGDGLFQVTCVPETIVVTEPNTLVVYQLIAPTPPNILFSGYTDPGPAPTAQQLSQPATVSADGTMMAIFDADSNSDVEPPLTIQVKLWFIDTENPDIPFIFDPQVTNDGRAGN